MNIRSGRFKKEMDEEAASFTSSLDFDRRIFQADIECNIAHTTMLQEQGIIEESDAQEIISALYNLLDEGIEALELDPSIEDIHMAVEKYVSQQIGDVAGFMHTAKSRNDQVATDLRIALKEELEIIQHLILNFMKKILEIAEKNTETIIVGYTHLQHAQPTTWAHHLLSYAQALQRDYQRIEDTYQRVDQCPLGAAALTTSSFPIDRERTKELLGFSQIIENSMDAVSSRDFLAETVFSLALLSTTLSRICEEIILWNTYEFNLLEISDQYSSTSSIMPQKKNPDVAEIARAKTGVLFGELISILTIMKALPQTYNRDLQELTPHLWNAVDTSKNLLNITCKMLGSVKIRPERGVKLANANFSTATELADLIVKEKQMPFRIAHKIVGMVVSKALEAGMSPEDIDSIFLNICAVEVGVEAPDIPDELIKQALNPLKNIKSRKVVGGPAPESIKRSIVEMRRFIMDKSQT